MSARREISARIVIESNAESMERTIGYVISALKTAPRNIRDGTVLLTLYDEHDRIIGADMSGTPTQELQDEYEDMLDKFSESPISVTHRPH